ncbi:DUF4386 family protein [Blastococcus sp. CT_GayMR16]|uniref:DUF4386 family protein n=1 Tax=Blastococcus sp. CT_GayMR16 TaxID=2559607 RepID=UPI0010733508|nr:DUF4386 family protein [Blastococcus sp. CT_GayMR16]TFV86266.1 hypothetical protein E4P38_17320 [Blastococcus sp. CT_GayMR16]
METRPGSQTGGPAVVGHGHGGDGRKWDSIAGIAGLVFIVLIVASFFTPDTPGSDVAAERIAEEITADESGHQMSLLLGFLADLAFFVFLAGLWSRLRRWEGPAGMLSGLVAIAGAAFVAMILVSEGIYLAFVKGATEGDAAALPALAVLDDWVGASTVVPGTALFAAIAAAILTTRALPAWLGWLSALAALSLLVSVLGVFQSTDDEGALGFVGFAGFLLLLIWVLAASVVLLMKAGGSGGYDEAGPMRASGQVAA